MIGDPSDATTPESRLPAVLPSAALPSPGAARTARRWVTTACMLAMFMAAVEGTIVAIAMPKIVAELGGFELFSAVFAAYFLCQAVSTPIYGRLSDLYGRRPVFLGGAALFLLSSAACGFAWGMVPLVAFRTLQGLGAGAIQPLAITIVGDIYEPADRARMQGWLSSIWGISAVAGPALGGFIVQHLSWSLVFWINLPIGAATVAILLIYFREDAQPRRHRIDYLGALLLSLGVGAAMLAIVQEESLGPGRAALLGAFGALALAALVVQERRASEPIIPFRLWRHRVIAIGNFGGLAIGALMMGVSGFLPTYVQGVMGRSPTVAGAVIATSSVAWSVVGIGASRMMVRTSYRTTGAIGGVLLLAGTVLLIALRPDRGPLWAAAGAFLIGSGLGFCNTTFIVAVQSAVTLSERGAATAATMFMRVIGQSLGAAVAGAILNFGVARAVPGAAGAAGGEINRLLAPEMRARLGAATVARLGEAIAASLHDVYVITFVLAAATLALAWRLPAGLSAGRPAVGPQGTALGASDGDD